MERICRQGTGLFPKPAEIRFSCSCPDYASMCKHVAARSYGVGARLDAKPELLFRLRGWTRMIWWPISVRAADGETRSGGGKVLEADDMAALFGLDMGEAEGPAPIAARVPVMKAPAPRKTAAAPKPDIRKVAPAKKSAVAKKIAARATAARTKPPASRKVGRSGSAGASAS